MSDPRPLSAEELEQLALFDTPTICNVIELFEVQAQTAGYLDGRIQCCAPKMRPMVGFASTATCRSGAPRPGASGYEKLGEQFEAFNRIPRPPVIVFQDLEDPPRAACFGDMMCSSYKAFGAVGLITSGAGRDLDQVEALGFPVFTSGTICSHGYPQILDIHVPVSVGGLTIYPGDLIHADRNGVTTIPIDIAADVARACQEYMDAEQVVLNYAQSTPSPTLGEFQLVQKKSLSLRKQMKQRLSRKAK